MRITLLICSSLLLIGIVDLPVGYYTLLRIVVTLGAALIIYNEYQGVLNATIAVFGIIAILFNPILPIYLHDKSAWTIIDLIVAIIFGVKAFTYNNK